jgi:anti-sigma B factor antagonist
VHAEQFSVRACDRTLRVQGEIDLDVADQLVEAIVGLAETVTSRTVVVDMAAVTFLDSTGIGALILARKQLEAMEHDLVLHNVPEQVREIMALTGVAEYLNVRSVAA